MNTAKCPPSIVTNAFAGARMESTNEPRRLRANPRINAIPIIMYAPLLQAEDIEDIAPSGLMWLQIGTADNLKLIAAVRGVLAASGVVHPA